MTIPMNYQMTYPLGNKIKLSALLLFFIAFVQLQEVIAQVYPAAPSPPRLVNDFVGILGADQERMLEDKLRRYHDTTSTQIAVVIIATTGGEDPAMYGTELGQRWGIGQEGNDNGLIVLVAYDDRKVQIVTGYGMEATVTDAMAKRVINQYIQPRFKEGKYFEGIDESTSIIMSLAAGEYSGEPEQKAPRVIGSILLLLFIVIFPLLRSRAVKKNHYGSKPMGLFTALMLGSAMGRGRGSSFNDFRGGGGSFGGGGGGFSGFGGGGFGGGGAGGSW